MELNELLELSLQRGASDLHLMPGVVPLLRIHGELAPIAELPVFSPEETRRLIDSFLTPEQQKHFETQLALDTAIHLPNLGNFRASVFHQQRGIACVFRMIPEKIPTVDELALPAILKSLLVLSQGLILVVGPTGSGKSTTLAAMIDYINNFRACNIITIEDPIEFIYPNKKSSFNQLQVGRDTPDFASALRAALRQDPDVILLGEMRDLETIRLALTAAETGHLVMATLHAASAPLAVSRIADVFPSEEKNRVRSLLSETLQAVIFQTLVKKTTGGRVAAFEIMVGTSAIRHYIRQDMAAHMESTIQTSGDRGMCTLDQYLNELVSKGVIGKGVAHQVMLNRGTFREPPSNTSK